MTDDELQAIRKAYDAAVERHAATLDEVDPGKAMAYRHACALVWHHADVLTLARQAADGTISFMKLLIELRPYVREALDKASPAGPDGGRLH